MSHLMRMTYEIILIKCFRTKSCMLASLVLRETDEYAVDVRTGYISRAC